MAGSGTNVEDMPPIPRHHSRHNLACHGDEPGHVGTDHLLRVLQHASCLNLGLLLNYEETAPNIPKAHRKFSRQVCI